MVGRTDYESMAGLAKTDLLILGDWGLAKFSAEQRRDFLELFDDRHGNRSTVVTSQVPVDHWHGVIGDPTLGDAILDRLVHNAYRINLKGESWRIRYSKSTTATPSEQQCQTPRRFAPTGDRFPLEWVAAFAWVRWQLSRRNR